jgi:hypothetical protein
MKRLIFICSLGLISCQTPPGDNTNTNSNSNIVNIFGPTDPSLTPSGCNQVKDSQEILLNAMRNLVLFGLLIPIFVLFLILRLLFRTLPD